MSAIWGQNRRIWDVTWATLIRDDALRGACVQEFNDGEIEDDPILRGIDKNTPVARNPCLPLRSVKSSYGTRPATVASIASRVQINPERIGPLHRAGPTNRSDGKYPFWCPEQATWAFLPQAQKFA